MRNSNISAAVDHFWAAGDHDLAAHAINGNILAVVHSRGAPPVDLHVDIGERDPNDSVAEVAGYAAALLMNGRPAEARALLEQIDISATTISPTERMHLQCLVVPTQLMLGDSSKAAEAADQILELLLDGAQIDEWTSMMTPIGIKSYAWEENFDGVESSSSCSSRRSILRSSTPTWRPPSPSLGTRKGCWGGGPRGRAVHAHLTSVDRGDHGIDLVARTVLGCSLVEIGEFEAAAEHLSVLATPRPERVPMFVLASLGRAPSCERKASSMRRCERSRPRPPPVANPNPTTCRAVSTSWRSRSTSTSEHQSS